MLISLGKWYPRRDYKETELRGVYEEMDQQGEAWPGLKAGLFGGSLERLADARQKFDETRDTLRQGLGIH